MSSGKGSAKKSKRGQGSIRRTKSGTYEYRIYYRDEFGNSRTRSFTCKTIDECIERADDFKKNKVMNVSYLKADITLSEILRRKARIDLDKNHTSESGYDRTISTIEIIERRGLGKMKIMDIKPMQIEIFLNSITYYSNTVIQKVHGLLRSAFRLAYDARLIEFNYMLMPELKCPKSSKQDKKVRGLTDDEQKALLEVLEQHKGPYGRNDYKLQLLIELYGGLRMGEINALRPDNIHLEKGYLHVDSTVSRGINCEPFIKDRTKTYAGTRDVPISKTLRPVLEKALSEMKPNPLGLIFYDHNKGGIIETSQVNAFFRRATEKAGIPITGQHSLRHTFATRCIEAGVPALVLKKWLGHTNIHITLDTYADVFAKMDFNATDKFDELMEELELRWDKWMNED